jgi:hypothetical protein
MLSASKAWLYLCGLLGAFAGALALAMRHQGLATAALPLIEARHAPAIEKAKTDLALLRGQAVVEAQASKDAQAAVDAAKAPLQAVYELAGLSADDIAAKFNALGS